MDENGGYLPPPPLFLPYFSSFFFCSNVVLYLFYGNSLTIGSFVGSFAIQLLYIYRGNIMIFPPKGIHCTATVQLVMLQTNLGLHQTTICTAKGSFCCTESPSLVQ